jgi:hypothetical protein
LVTTVVAKRREMNYKITYKQAKEPRHKKIIVYF